MGKKNQQVPVYDYHYSLDYGLCHGPIDHLNAVWVKDKQILCDVIDRRTDYEIYLPELFGGDDAEGGVVGTLEVYTGAPDQYASAELASRSGRTVGQTPGYRNVAHLFFRGLRDSASEQATIAALGDGIPQTIFRKRLKQPPPGGYPSAQIGWRWTTNNPYMPDMKANMTRLPGAADDPYRAIWPLGATFGSSSEEVTNTDPQPISYFRDDNGVGVDPFAPGTVVDLFDQGADQGQIDAGEVLLRVDWTLILRSWNRQAGGTVRTSVKFYSQKPTIWDQDEHVIAPLGGENGLRTEPVSLTYDTRDGWEGTMRTEIDQLTVPPGARFAQIATSYDSPDAYRVTAVGSYTVAVGVPLPEPGEEPPQYLVPTGDLRVIAAGEVPVSAIPPWSVSRMAFVDLYSLGVTQAEIDAGLIQVGQVQVVRLNQGIPVMQNVGEDNFITAVSNDFREMPEHWAAGWVGAPDDWPPGSTIKWDTTVGEIFVPLRRVAPTARIVGFRAGYVPAVGLSVDVDMSAYQVVREAYAAHWCLPDQTLGPLPDANPAHIIYECMTNAEWGKGTPEALMNAASYNAVAERLYNERMGMSIGWFQQSDIESFIGDVLDHVQAVHYFDPGTGQYNLKLLRDDYDVASLKTLDPSNCVATNRKRRLWGETINEIVVSYTDPQTEKEATVSAQNLANIAIQGGVISETRDYHGFRNPNIAQLVAERDVAEAGYPLFSCEIEVDRSEWDARPGDCRKFTWPEDGIEEIVIRVMDVDYGKPTDRTIKLAVTEDIFSIDRAQYGEPQRSEWSNAVEAPTPLEAQAAITVPLPTILRAGETVEDWDENYPSVAVALLADDDGLRPSSIVVTGPVQRPNGSSGREQIGSIGVTLSGRIGSPLVAEAETRLPRNVIDGITRTGAQAGDFFMLGVTNADSELVMLDSLDVESGEWVVARGMWDTTPRAWPSGTRLWRFRPTLSNLDPGSRAAGETVEYLLQPVTQLGTLPQLEAVPLEVTFNDRPYAPFRPANCQLDGTGFAGAIYREEPFPTEFEATWVTRNRTTEDTVALRWTEADAAPEVGQTTVLRILDSEGAVHSEITGLTGNSRTILVSELPPGRIGWIEFLSERDGIRSVYGARLPFDIRPPVGYGLAYGLGYGGDS
jgi:hypothetical protein